jgi:membrane associated rhomboid family serine protease
MARIPRTGFPTLSFPSFRGVTSQLVLANVAVFFLLLLMEYAAPRLALIILNYFSLTQALLLRGWVWQLATYSFLNTGVLHVAFNMLTLWFIGSFLELEGKPLAAGDLLFVRDRRRPDRERPQLYAHF